MSDPTTCASVMRVMSCIGIDVEMTVFWAFEADGERVTRMHLYPGRDQALEAIERWRG